MTPTCLLPLAVCKLPHTTTPLSSLAKSASPVWPACRLLLSLEDSTCRFVGDFTAADVIMSFPVETLKDRTAGFDKYPHLAKYLEQVHERPAYKRAEEKGGKLELVG